MFAEEPTQDNIIEAKEGYSKHIKGSKCCVSRVRQYVHVIGLCLLDIF